MNIIRLGGGDLCHHLKRKRIFTLIMHKIFKQASKIMRENGYSLDLDLPSHTNRVPEIWSTWPRSSPEPQKDPGTSKLVEQGPSRGRSKGGRPASLRGHSSSYHWNRRLSRFYTCCLCCPSESASCCSRSPLVRCKRLHPMGRTVNL